MIVAISKKEASCPNIPKTNLIVPNLICIRETLSLVYAHADHGVVGVRN
jgi:hypothetical protein